MLIYSHIEPWAEDVWDEKTGVDPYKSRETRKFQAIKTVGGCR